MNQKHSHKPIIAIIGGTGKEGKGLAYRWVRAGYPVVIGSRKIDRALDAVEDLKKMLMDEKHQIRGLENFDAAKAGDILVLTVPYQYHQQVLESLVPYSKNKFFLDVTVPLVPPKVTTINIPQYGSAALEAKNILGESVKVISAFQNISFELLLGDDEIECDVLVCGSDAQSRSMGIQLVEDAGLKAWDAGVLENAIVAEGLTSILIRINKQNNVHSAGIKITGIPSN